MKNVKTIEMSRIEDWVKDGERSVQWSEDDEILLLEQPQAGAPISMDEWP